MNFYPRPPRGGRPQQQLNNFIEKSFLSTPSARRATLFLAHKYGNALYFYPRPPRGGRPAITSMQRTKGYFYPRPPRGGRLPDLVYMERREGISIHALREEGDGMITVVTDVVREFLSTPSARRATHMERFPAGMDLYFYPRPPRGGRRLILHTAVPSFYFYPRPPRGGRRFPWRPRDGCPCISIHALREEGDHLMIAVYSSHIHFYPRPPRGGRRWPSGSCR